MRRRTNDSPANAVSLAALGIPTQGQAEFRIVPGDSWVAKRDKFRSSLPSKPYGHETHLIVLVSGLDNFVRAIAWINRHMPVPTRPPADASPTTVLTFDRQNLLAARIIECLFSDPQYTYLLVLWLYWPEELPMGRQPYRGQQELVMSNAMMLLMRIL